MKKFFNWYGKKLIAKPKKFLLTGVLLAALVMIIGFVFGGHLSNQQLTVGKTPADRATNVVKKHFGQAAAGAQIQIVLKSRTKLTSPTNQQKIAKLQQAAAKTSKITSVLTPAMQQNYAENDHVGYLTLVYKNKNLTNKQTKQIRKIAADHRSSQLKVELSGITSKVVVSEVPEIVGLAIAFVILTIAFASFTLAGVPIISAIIGLVTGLAAILFTAKTWTVESYDLALAAMVSLAVGIDYALFLVARFREEFQTKDKNQALRNTISSTAPSVLFAGSTIVVALLSMSALGIKFLGIMGGVSALSVILVVILTLLIVPSVLYLLPLKAKQPTKHLHVKPAKIFAGIVNKTPFLVAIITIAILCLAALPVKQLNLGLPNDGSKQLNTTERKAFDIKQKAYGAGSDATLVAVVKNKNAQTVPNLVQKVKKLAGVHQIGQPTISSDQKYVMLSVVPKTEANAKKTQKLVHQLRKIKLKEAGPVMVTGSTAMNIDISARLMSALPKFLLIIVAFSFILLMLAFRSFLIPLVAVVGFILSLAATMGSIVYTVQLGNFAGILHLPGKTAILNFLPVLDIGILFGLAMDYEVFLVSRIHEEYLKSHDNQAAVAAGVSASGGSVLAAALIMISVFASFSFTDEIIIQMMGLSLAFGVFFDALIVRLMLVPAAIRIFGKANWYFPKWLDKILPNLNIE
ncbi:MMPL family transporter [Liquorilactobacillus ghanensis]|uniref:MMPL family transporter n=1 Tax=Liquorilactobacillus ghanensis TaxID=399370 RepID=UPI0039E7C899